MPLIFLLPIITGNPTCCVTGGMSCNSFQLIDISLEVGCSLCFAFLSCVGRESEGEKLDL